MKTGKTGRCRMEQGVNLDDYGTVIPYEMAIAATNDEKLAYKTGRILAKKARAIGLHWTFSPVVELNLNYQNLVTNTRSFGGDGVDYRDQHLCTSVNNLPMDQW